MGIKPIFSFNDFISLFVQLSTVAVCKYNGLDDTTSETAGNLLSSLVSSVRIESTDDSFQTAIEKKAIDNITSRSDIPKDCISAIKGLFENSASIIDYICSPNGKDALSQKIVFIYASSPNADPDTVEDFANELADNIIGKFNSIATDNKNVQWQIILNNLKNTYKDISIHTDNKRYSDSFTTPLFLHQDSENSNVNLKNLFVFPKYKVHDESDPLDNLKERLIQFANSKTGTALFIEGDGGVGKTTLVGWINHYYNIRFENGQTLKQSFGNRPLVTIRLRDLDNDIIKDNGLRGAIRKYMNIESVREISNTFPNAIMILDGFDELCMINGIDHKNILSKLLNTPDLANFKFIVTSRQRYLPNELGEIKSSTICLQHFDGKKINEWLEKYKSIGQTITAETEKFISNIDPRDMSCVCDTPMTLYMIAAKGITEEMQDNAWLLYNHIFSNTLSETAYNRIFPNKNGDYEHPISEYNNILYQINEEIAYRMYQSENKDFYITDEDIANILDELKEKYSYLKNTETKSILEKCYALCCYWKTTEDRGAVEFLHNNIRDFFMAEKIWREVYEPVNAIIKKSAKSIDEEKKKALQKRLCELFSYDMFNDTVLKFLSLRAQNNGFSKTIKYMLTDEYEIFSIPSWDILSYKKEKNVNVNPIDYVTNVLTCMAYIRHYICKAYLSDTQRILWTEKSYDNNRYIFEKIFCPEIFLGNMHEHIGEFAQYTNLKINFAYLDYSVFYSSYMNHSILSATSLRNSTFENAHLESSHLDFSDLKDAVLPNVHLEYASLSFANLKRANLKNSHLDNSMLNSTTLDDANLSGANLTGAILSASSLIGTTLPDGFKSYDQQKQIDHLKSLNIPGLII